MVTDQKIIILSIYLSLITNRVIVIVQSCLRIEVLFMLSIEEVIKQLNKFPELKPKNLVPDLATYWQSPEKVAAEVISRVDDIRKELIKILDSTKDDAAYNTLLLLAELKPINDEDPSSMEKIKDDDKVFISTGFQFDIKQLITWHNTRSARARKAASDPPEITSKWLLHPVTNQRFCSRDMAHIRRVAEGKGIEINDTIQDTVQREQSPLWFRIFSFIAVSAFFLCSLLTGVLFVMSAVIAAVCFAAACAFAAEAILAGLVAKIMFLVASAIGCIGIPAICCWIGIAAGPRHFGFLVAGLAIGVLLVLSGVGILPGVAMLATTIGMSAGFLSEFVSVFLSMVGFSLLSGFVWGGRTHILTVLIGILIGIKNSIDFVVNVGKSIISLVTYFIHPEVVQVPGTSSLFHNSVLAPIAQRREPPRFRK
jgi:hypothetical protein